MNVLTWDAPGHASSRPFVLDFNLFDKAKWIDAILEKENIRRPVIVGQSMGGYVGQAYVQLFPEKLCGFVSIDAAPLQRKFVTAAELWILKHIEPVRHNDTTEPGTRPPEHPLNGFPMPVIIQIRTHRKK